MTRATPLLPEEGCHEVTGWWESNHESRFTNHAFQGRAAPVESAAFWNLGRRVRGSSGRLAQLVEQRTFNPLVGGSNPPPPTNP